MITKSNSIRTPDFVPTLMGLIAGVLIVVATAGFIFIPYSLSGHPGEVTLGVAQASAYHPT